MFINFWALLFKVYIFQVGTFFSRLVVIQSLQVFGGSTFLYIRFMFLMKHFSSLL